ncbi:MAG TPA: hypothetical protein VGM14_16800 [Streptosporangiaceae bacterium]
MQQHDADVFALGRAMEFVRQGATYAGAAFGRVDVGRRQVGRRRA